MEASLHRALTDKAYDKRKGAALEVEKVVREATIGEDVLKLSAIISQLCELAQNQHSNARSGGIMGLAAASCVILAIIRASAHPTIESRSVQRLQLI